MAEATKQVKQVSIMCFHDELCQVFNALMTALSLLRQGARVTVFFGSRGVNAIHQRRCQNSDAYRTCPRWAKR